MVGFRGRHISVRVLDRDAVQIKKNGKAARRPTNDRARTQIDIFEAAAAGESPQLAGAHAAMPPQKAHQRSA